MLEGHDDRHCDDGPGEPIMMLRLGRARPRDRGEGRGAAAGRQGPPGGHRGLSGRLARRPARRLVFGVLALAVAVAAGLPAYLLARRPGAAQVPRPSGIPARVSTSLATLITLDPLPPRAAPGFTLTDQAGRTISLASLRGKVVVLYFMDDHCTDICPIVSQEFRDAYRDLGPLAGKVVFAAVNANPYHRSVGAVAAFSAEQQLTAIPGWHFLTGDEPHIKQLADAVGFRYAYDPDSKQFAHAAGIMLLTPQGKISRYLYGVQYPVRDLRLGLVEASQGKIGSPVDRVLLFCYHYDPHTGKYGLLISHIIQLVGILTVLIGGFFLILLFRGEHYALPSQRP